jgi:hypothetical protein
VNIDGEFHYLHRLAWLYMTGKWPDPECDHRDGDGLNNRWVNLREADRARQMQNVAPSKSGASGLLGAHKSKDRWISSITVGGRQHYLGRFATAEEAHIAYLAAKARLHTFQPTPRV